MLEDVVLRVTAREYLDTLRAVLTSGGGQSGGEESLESGDKVIFWLTDEQVMMMNGDDAACAQETDLSYKKNLLDLV